MGGVLSVCIIWKGNIVSFVGLDIMVMFFGRIVESVFVIIWVLCKSIVMVLIVSVIKLLVSVCVFLMWLGRIVIVVCLIFGSWLVVLVVIYVIVMLFIFLGYFVMSLWGSVSVCLGLEVVFVVSVRNFFGEILMWSVEFVIVILGVLRCYSVISLWVSVFVLRVLRVYVVISVCEGIWGFFLIVYFVISVLFFGMWLLLSWLIGYIDFWRKLRFWRLVVWLGFIVRLWIWWRGKLVR